MTLINPAEHFANKYFLLQKYHFNINGLYRIEFVATVLFIEIYRQNYFVQNVPFLSGWNGALHSRISFCNDLFGFDSVIYIQ